MESGVPGRRLSVPIQPVMIVQHGPGDGSGSRSAVSYRPMDNLAVTGEVSVEGLPGRVDDGGAIHGPGDGGELVKVERKNAVASGFELRHLLPALLEAEPLELGDAEAPLRRALRRCRLGPRSALPTLGLPHRSFRRGSVGLRGTAFSAFVGLVPR